MPPTKQKRTVDNNKYNSQVAQVIESSGNFLNNVKNPWFIIVLVFMFGGGYIAYKATYVIANSMNHVADKIDNLTTTLSKQEIQNSQQINMLNDISKELKDYHSFQENRKG